MNHPQILSLNIDDDSINALKNKNFSIYNGDLGQVTELTYGQSSHLRCRLNADYPNNIHEYDIIMIDLTNFNVKPFNKSEHLQLRNKTSKESYFSCEHPQNIFDPRAATLHLLEDHITESLADQSILILFGGADEFIENTLIFNGDEQDYSLELYSFAKWFLPTHRNKHGKQTQVPDENNELHRLMKKYNSGFSYEITFEKPHVFKENKWIDDPNFFTLANNKQGEIVSFLKFTGKNSAIFFFPNMEGKSEFLTEFLENVAPAMFPALFPESSKNAWVFEPAYSLPNQERLIAERSALEKDYQEKMRQKDNEIAENNEQFAFLHSMLTQTDAPLVDSVIKFLNWLGFENVSDGDATVGEMLKQEDIHIDTDRGLLIFEVKGLGGTSKDSDCNQINKVKFRRAKERGSFDVFATYIVNHQRHLSPLSRNNPPFKPEQLKDAINEERALVTTWQLYNLYFDIERGVLTKEQARACFFRFGLLNFIPAEYLLIGTPNELFQGQTVLIINIPPDITIMVNDQLLISDKDGLQRLDILSIKIAEQHVQSASGLEAGIKLNDKVTKGCMVYLLTATTDPAV